jgi:2-iminobutanoate/2-iminopropanoate deaminase
MKLPLSPSVRLGPLLFVSGQLAFDDELKLVPGPVTAQTIRCLENIERILLKEGASREDILKITAWIVDARTFAEFNEAYAAFFGDHKPARSTVVAALVVPGAYVEIEAIARVP